MAKIRRKYIVAEVVLVTTIFSLILDIALCDDTLAIPADKSQLNSWLAKNIPPLSSRKGTLEPEFERAEANTTVINVRQDESGDFKTINDAINSIPDGNKYRVIISIGGGNYTEKIKIVKEKPYITFYGDPEAIPYLIFDGTAHEYGTVESATLIVESQYFTAVNINIVNSAPRPDGKMEGAQAVALTASGDKASFFNCRFYGFQDTLCDSAGRHFFKDCYIEGTVDFIFGNGKSLYLNTELHVIPGDNMGFITAHAKDMVTDTKDTLTDTGYSFVHCAVTGTGGGTTYLGRAWMKYASVVFAYTQMSNVVNPLGWAENKNDKTAFFGEYKNSGPGSDISGRADFTKKLMVDTEAKPFITLGFIDASKWLLPPTKL